MVKYKQEAEVGKIPQTKVTYTQQVDLGGRIPKWAQNRQGVSTLMYVIEHVSSFARVVAAVHPSSQRPRQPPHRLRLRPRATLEPARASPCRARASEPLTRGAHSCAQTVSLYI